MMKKSILFTLLFCLSHLLISQNRIASHVMFESGKERIEGILVRPHQESNTPAVVFQQGSGASAFEGYEKEAWGPHKYYIEDILLEQGYAVLYCNKRGLGNSAGKWQHNDFYGRADDTYAAISYLKSLPFIDSTRIGVAGHSQGGWIAQIAAAQHPELAFIICLAGPTVGVKEQVISYEKSFLICKGIEGKKLEKKVRKNIRWKNFSAWIGKNLSFPKSAKHWSLIYDYDNDEILKAISCPSLLLFGEYDNIVDPAENIDHLNQLFDGNPPDNISVEVMPGGQHGFYKVSDPCVDWDSATKQPFDPSFREKIRRWVINLGE